MVVVVVVERVSCVRAEGERETGHGHVHVRMDDFFLACIFERANRVR